MSVLYCIIIFVVGLILGSFYGCIGYRIPNKISVLKPGSFCEHCKKPLKWYMNIPFISFICLRGKCSYCKHPIDISNFFIEIFTAVTFMFSYLYFGFSSEFLIALILLSALAITAVTDFKYYYISDRVVFISLFALVMIYITKGNLVDQKWNFIAMIGMFVLMLLVKLIGDRVFKKECLGGGDIKLMLIMGLVLGLVPSLFALFVASILALLAALVLREKHNKDMIPFGPFILLSTIMVYILNYGGFLDFLNIF